MKFIKQRDQFGHQTQFKFNNKGSSHSTFCGGCVSIFIVVFMIFYVVLLVKKLVWMQDDSIQTVIKQI